MATITFVDIASLAKKTPDGSEKIPISSTQYVSVSDIMGQLNYVECTYAELVTLRNATQLQAGNYYLITDYQTVYVQPNTNAVKTSLTIEPLLVLAISDSDISNQAWSINHPKDTIWYDIDGANYQWVYSGATMITHKGVITRRIDEFGNDLPYDFKTIKFARYKIDIDNIEVWETGIKTYAVGDIVTTSALNAIYICIQPVLYNSDGPEDNDSPYWARLINASGITSNALEKWYISPTTTLTKSVLNVDYTIPVDALLSKEFFTFDNNGVDASISGLIENNIIKKCKSTKYTLPNSVYMDAVSVYSNTIGANSINNTIGGDAFTTNLIGDYFSNNIISSGMISNVIKDGFSANLIDVDFNANHIGIDFRDNLIESSFMDNIIQNTFQDNIIRESLLNCNIGVSFKLNTLCGRTISCNIGSNFIGNFALAGLSINISNNLNVVAPYDLQAIDIYDKTYILNAQLSAGGDVVIWWYGATNTIETIIITND